MKHVSIASPARASLWRITQAATNLFLVGLFALQLISSCRGLVRDGSIRSVVLLAVSTLFLTLFLSRRRAQQESERPLHWALGVAGTALPLLMRPGGGDAGLQIGAAMQILGLTFLGSGLLSLRRSFGIVAANRGVRSGGMYRLVRHPIYFAELLAFAGFFVSNPTVLNGVILLCECGLQFARALIEERLLLGDAAYRRYCEQVKYRLIPGLV